MVCRKEKATKSISGPKRSVLPIRVAQFLVLSKNIIATQFCENVPAAGLAEDVGDEGGLGLVSEAEARNFIFHSAEGTLGGFYSNISMAPLSG